jgi:Flp pilus assembly protein TadD
MMLPFLVTALMLAQTPAPSNAEAELQAGIALTRSGHFKEAIPHFLNARGRVEKGVPSGM